MSRPLLPLGDALTQFVIEATCGTLVADALLEMWGAASAAVTAFHPECSLGNAPRLEAVLDEVSRVQFRSRTSEFDFLSGFAAFGRAPFNSNHAAVASLLLDGTSVVTTNFDTCIESAFEAMTGRRLVQDSRMPLVFHDTKSGSQVFHVHGVATDVGSLLTTVARIKGGLPEPSARVLGLLLDGAEVTFLGYSMSDSFDITPHFTPRRYPSASALFVQHGHGSVPPSVLRVLKAFGVSRSIQADTDAFLGTLAGAVGSPTTPAKAIYDWRGEFNSAARVAGLEQVSGLLVLGIADLVGVSPLLLAPDAMKRSRRAIRALGSDFYHLRMAIASDALENRRASWRHRHARTTLTRQDWASYRRHYGIAARRAEGVMPLEELEVISGTSGSIGWPYYISLSHYAQELLRPYLEGRSGSVGFADAGMASRVASVARALANRGLHNVDWVNQAAMAQRRGWMVGAITGELPDEEEEKATVQLYCDNASVAGCFGAIRDGALARVVYSRVTGDVSVLPEARRRWRIACEIEAAVHHSPHFARMLRAYGRLPEFSMTTR